MKATVVIPSSIVLSLAFLAVLRMRKTNLEKLEKQKSIGEMKFRVTNEMLIDIQQQLQQETDSSSKKGKYLKEQRDECERLQEQSEALKKQLGQCDGEKKVATEQMSQVEIRSTDIQRETKEEETAWKKEISDLENTFKEMSPVCDYLKPGSEQMRALCGSKVAGDTAQNEASKDTDKDKKADKPDDLAAKPEEAKAPEAEQPKKE